MEKVIKDGKVAVCYSPHYGAGWSTWNNYEFRETLLFSPKIVNMVLEERQREINADWLADNLGEEFHNVYCGGAEDLEVVWLPQGTIFRVNEYDGNESLTLTGDNTTFRA